MLQLIARETSSILTAQEAKAATRKMSVVILFILYDLCFLWVKFYLVCVCVDDE
jgi:hypothetical protein